MKRSELAIAAHNAIHSGAVELALPETSWRIRIAPTSGVRCVAVYSGDIRFYFQQQDAWPKQENEFSILARLGHQITWMVQRHGEQFTKSIIIDGQVVDDLSALNEVDLETYQELVT